MEITAITWIAGAFLTSVVTFISINNMQQEEYTTNEFDRIEAAKLKARLKDSSQQSSNSPRRDFKPIDTVQIAPGRHKYVLVSAREPSNPEFTYFVTSRKGAAFHRNAAEPLVHSLKKAGYKDIEIKGGGRISFDEQKNHISVFGFSYSFGQPNHEITKKAILADKRFKEMDVSVSNEGY
jgi:hypothetical protein